MELLLAKASGHLSVGVFSFFLILLAEFGDKSQLVCMSLAAKYRPIPVFWGALFAFSGLNFLAVFFGSVVSDYIPEFWLNIVVAALFAVFGLHALLSNHEQESADDAKLGSKSLFLTTLLMLFVAEFGDKTQLSVAGLASNYQPLTIWLSSTLALAVSTAIGVVIGGKVFKRFSQKAINKLSGILFLIIASLLLSQL